MAPLILEDINLDFKDVLFRPQKSTINSRSEVNLIRRYKFKHSAQDYEGVPVIAANMDTIGTFEMARALNEHNLFTTIHKHYDLEQWVQFAKQNPEVLKNIAVSSGTGKSDQEKIDKILEAIPEIGYICVDVANGYCSAFVDFVKQTRHRYPAKTIIAGNVITGEMVEEIIHAGADIVKVGIGPGSVCTTRKKAGVGRPQLTAVIECAEAAHKLGGHIISDGGCTEPGDICKAFGAGADFVMLGGMLAGHKQCSGELKTDAKGNQVMLFYGMSSKLAQEKYSSGLASYRASEGKVVTVPYRGDVCPTITDILGGLRSICTYTNSPNLEQLAINTTFFKVHRTTNEVFHGREVEQ